MLPTTLAPPAAPSPSLRPHSALFRFYDKNGDQVLAEGRGGKTSAKPVREWLAKQKVDVAAGLTKEAFETHAPKLMDYLSHPDRGNGPFAGPLPTQALQAAPSTGRPPVAAIPARASSGPGSRSGCPALVPRMAGGKAAGRRVRARDMNGDGVVTATEFDQTKALASTARHRHPRARPATPGGSGQLQQRLRALPPRTGERREARLTVLATTPSTPAAGSGGLGTTASRLNFPRLSTRTRTGWSIPMSGSGSRVVGPQVQDEWDRYHEEHDLAKIFTPTT